MYKPNTTDPNNDFTKTTATDVSGEAKRKHDSDADDSRPRKKINSGAGTLGTRNAIAKEEYTVGWVCALPLEMAAAKGMLDQVHPNLSEQDPADHNSYVLGEVQGHNVVIACLPAGIYGLTSAAAVAKDLLRTFKSIRFGLMVGIGGGAPSGTQDIRLGDIVVSQPSGTSGGVIQYDRGKKLQKGTFQRTGSLNAPPKVLLGALNRLKADHLIEDSKIPQYLAELVIKSPKRMKKNFSHQGASNDHLFQKEYEHVDTDTTCGQCDRTRRVQRNERDDTDPVIHYGNIASGNQVIEHGKTRDRLSRELGVLCFEMEAAGLQDFPCLVIRGICDYADSHKNDIWQAYAAATAAAFAKELLSVIPPERVLQEKAIPQLTSDPRLHTLVSDTNTAISIQTQKQQVRYENQKQIECHRTFKTSTYEVFKNINPDRVPGTCKWVLEHQRYQTWQQSPHDDLLWISADPGCGKSVLAKALVDEEFQHTNDHTVCYFFFKDNDEQNSLATALCALLHQLFHYQPLLLRYAIDAFEKNGEKLQTEVNELWRIFIAASTDDQAVSVTCVLEALDECCVDDQRKLIRLLTNFYNRRTASKRRSQLKFLVTSRPYQDIEFEFRDIPEAQSIRLAGEDHNTNISDEINLVVKDRVATVGRKLQLSQEVQSALKEKLLSVTHRTYLWLHLVMDEIYHSPKRHKKAFIKELDSLPATVEDAYEKILGRINYNRRQEAQLLLHIVVSARRPLTLLEMDVAFQLATDSSDAQTHDNLDLDNDHLTSRIRELCGLFVFINDHRIYLIHQTAKEFLVTQDGIAYPAGGLWKNSLCRPHSDAIMTQICVQYLSFKDIQDGHFSFDDDKKIPDIDTIQYPFLDYSATHWPAHLREASAPTEDIQRHILWLYDTENQRFQTWFSIFWKANYPYALKDGLTNVHLAALNGHDEVLSRLLALDENNLNLRDKLGQTPLIWGSLEGHKKIVQMLLDNGADVSVQDRPSGNALLAASARGHEKIVQMLLDKGVDVNEQGGQYGNALSVASARGHDKVVQMLLNNSADVNAQCGLYSNALSAASEGGHDKIVQMLLNNGADVTAQGGPYGNALSAASARGHYEVVQMLLNNSADINAQGGQYSNALSVASARGHDKVVQILLNKGIDVNAQGGHYGNALYAASARGHDKIVQMLLDKGADVNARSRRSGNALYAASARGHDKIVQMLLNNGADVTAQGGPYGNALSAASAGGHDEVVQMLLNKGADVNARGRSGNALTAASAGGHDKVVQMLLGNGADNGLHEIISAPISDVTQMRCLTLHPNHT
ncbi:Ankyrin repeat domain-containing protein 50-like protein 3 [Colletotrichum chlorophyti]|uniref:Ankyrin repeat domain-containing protein 50-like protein 3 n=1 Tax=Colletotrichum chlorophyti TaxID=708187 RepID=A0A1Q8RU84_9PEZI|nr:Ankyrin repeat domain-containing protein 50-like protein 3 [Colletotrichum chlorophyti]